MALSRKRAWLVAACSALALALAGCGKGKGTNPTGAGAAYLAVPTTVDILSGNGQSGQAGTTLPQPLVVRVVNAGNMALPSIPVTFTVTTGAGHVAATSVSTDQNGDAETPFTLSTTAGPNAVTATVAGATVTPSVTFTATGDAGPPATLSVPSGGTTTPSGSAGSMIPLTVVVSDANGNPIPGATVSFTITSGGGSLSAVTVTASDLGQAQVTLTLPGAAGVTTVTASTPNFPPQPLTFTVTTT